MGHRLASTGTIAAESPVVSILGEADMLMVRVRNHGAFIPKKAPETIFTPLTQLARHADTDARLEASARSRITRRRVSSAIAAWALLALWSISGSSWRRCRWQQYAIKGCYRSSPTSKTSPPSNLQRCMSRRSTTCLTYTFFGRMRSKRAAGSNLHKPHCVQVIACQCCNWHTDVN